jgi:HAE1 family hydrophobic/amphiphilic exporter-1
MLTGLVTKNAILVVDFTNQLRRRGIPRDDALKQAGPIRLRPVLMTTFATIGGMLPVALNWGGGAGSEIKTPMAVAVIGGLITSTFLTLVVVPVVYAIFDSATVWVVRNVFRIR